MNMFTRIKNKIWDSLFLDFYLDPRWTLEFKILNIISRGFLLTMLTALHSQFVESYTADYLKLKRTKYWTNQAWDIWYKGD